MGVKVHQGRVVGKVIVCGVNAKVGVGNGGSRHIQRIDNLLEVGGRMIRGDVIGENGKELDEGRKAKRTAYLTKRTNKSPDEQSNHMTINKRSETDLRTIKERSIENRSKINQGKTNRKPILTEPRSLFNYKGKG